MNASGFRPLTKYKIQWIFFFNDTATTEIYTLSLHDALPIYQGDLFATHHASRKSRNHLQVLIGLLDAANLQRVAPRIPLQDRKSTRLNSSHSQISYAVFCLKINNFLFNL